MDDEEFGMTLFLFLKLRKKIFKMKKERRFWIRKLL